MATFDLLFSDTEVGTHEFGFIARKGVASPGAYQAEDEDRSYRGHLLRQGFTKVAMGPSHAATFTLDDLELGVWRGIQRILAKSEWQKSG